MALEQYREKVQITKWRDGAVMETRSLGCGWFAEDVVEANKPRESGIMYIAASDDFARNNMTVRVARDG